MRIHDNITNYYSKISLVDKIIKSGLIHIAL